MDKSKARILDFSEPSGAPVVSSQGVSVDPVKHRATFILYTFYNTMLHTLRQEFRD